MEPEPAAGPLRPLLWWPGRRLPALRSRGGRPPGRSGVREPRAPWLVLADRRDGRLAPAAALLAPLLDGPERERRERFRREEDRQRFLLGRGLLRLALGAWLGRDPCQLRFCPGPHGKPELAGPGAAAIHFNVAHSGDLILLAFHPACPVGVDVERLRPELAWEPLARRLLEASECRRLEGLSAGQGAGAFLAAWCRLEARLKARGEGLWGLERLQQADRLAPQRAGERFWTVAVPPSYRAAVALGPAA